MNEKLLNLLSKLRDYKIEITLTNQIIVMDEDYDLTATIDTDNEIQYFMDGCYNSGADSLEINIDKLLELKAFCEFLIKWSDE